MNLKFPFSSETRHIYLYEYSCWLCGRSNRGLELHHIYGRVSASPYNASVVCMECHSHMGHSQTEQESILKLAVLFLASAGYEPNSIDIGFLETTGFRNINWWGVDKSVDGADNLMI